ncbi:MAG: HEAT repeat domain-containing protein [Elusimicrobia bacterium]|nr:HEAT repeat domain-containing protein [Elusimicrobiota bacterium]
MTRSVAIALLVLIAAAPVHAGLEEAAGTAANAFKAAWAMPAFKLLPALAKTALHAASDEDQLIDLLSDRDPAVRAQAARSLRNYALTSYRAENALLESAGSDRELESVRREAIKSLAWAAQHFNTKDKLLSIANDSRQTDSLRAIALKSLYVVTNMNDVKSSLQDTLKNGRESFSVRAAAAWSLWTQAQNDYGVRGNMLEVAQNSSESDELRVEAVKSLYAAMTDWNAKNAVWDLSRNESLDESIREAATLCLHLVNNDWSVRNYLQDASKSSTNAKVKLAAIKALGGPSMELTRYFHLSHYLGRFIDPLEDQ